MSNKNHYENEPEEEATVACAICKCMPDDILILTCDHNLCLNCAAHNLIKQQRKNSNSYQVSAFK